MKKKKYNHGETRELESRHYMRVARRLREAPTLLAAMLLCHVIWLVGKALLGRTPIWEQFPALLVCSVLLFLVLACTPARCVARLKPLWQVLAQREWLQLLILCVLGLTIGLFNAANQPVGVDESNVLDVSRIVAEEGVGRFLTDYATISWFGTHHPPLAPLIYGFVMRMAGDNLFVLRLVPLLFGLSTIVVTYLTGKTLYGRDTAFLAGFLLLTFPFLYRDGGEAKLDIQATFFVVLAVCLILRLLHKPAYGLSVAAGLCIGVALLFRYTTVLIYPLLLITSVADRRFRPLRGHLVIALLVSIAVLAPWLGYALHSGVLLGQARQAASYAGLVAYSVSHAVKWAVVEFGRKMIPMLGAHNLPLLLWGGVHLLQRRGPSDRFVLLWIVVVFVPLWLTCPDPRYFMPAFPALAIAVAQVLQRPSQGTARILLFALFCSVEVLFVYIQR